MATESHGRNGPPDPQHPDQPLDPFVDRLEPRAARRLAEGSTTRIDIRETGLAVRAGWNQLPVWGYGLPGEPASSPGPLIEVEHGKQVTLSWRNRLPGSIRPGDPKPAVELPFVTAVVDDPDDSDSVQNHLGADGGTPENETMAPIGWTVVHLHGGHSRPDADGWPDHMVRAGNEQTDVYDNTYDNTDPDVALGKVGSHLWYHDHAMNGTRYHVFAGLAGGYLVRDPAERDLGLPTCVEEGEFHLLLQDRNVTGAPGELRLLHKTTPDTGEFFGPLTLVDGVLWPRLELAPGVFRLRLLNGSNARAYRLHLVEVAHDGTVTPQHGRLLVIGADGGLLWRAAEVANDKALVLAPAERLDVLIDLTGLPAGSRLHLLNSAQAPFQGADPPDLTGLWRGGDDADRNPYPWVARIDVTDGGLAGRGHELFTGIAAAELNPAFRRLVHDASPPADGEPPQFPLAGHAHRIVLLGETDPPGHLYLQEVAEDPFGAIELQLPGDLVPKRYRVEGWMNSDQSPSSTRVSFYDRIALRPRLGQWQIWRFVNTTGDTHPIHIHQSQFQPVGDTAALLATGTVDGGPNRYDPTFRRTSAPLTLETDPGRAYEPQELHGWKDVIRVDPGNVVSVAIRFDIPGRYVYHCHVLEHEDTEMMRPFVVTVTDMDDPGAAGMAHM
jgi:FtsP/CotA-like multicopper oxidase with cupredoxin domain